MDYRHNKKFTNLRSVIAPLILVLLCYTPAIYSKSDKALQDSTISYEDSYFSEYKVVTLTDMIRLIPGGVSILNDLNNNQQSRGLGSTGAQILIDGKRMSGKSNDMEKRLSRIQANQVERIDLIRGNAEGLDIRSKGILINVILTSDVSEEITYLSELRITHNNQQKTLGEFLINGSGRSEKFEYDFGLNHDLYPRVSDFEEDRMDEFRNIEEKRFINREFLWTNNNVTTNLQYTFDNGDVLRFNGLYQKVKREEDNFEDQFDFLTGDLLGEEELRIDRKETAWEIGGDYETKLGDLGTLKTIIISNKESNDDTIVQDEIVNGQIDRLFTFAEDSEEIEQIIRSNLSMTVLGDQTLELGVEAAFNELDAMQSFDLEPFESSNIQEDRYELFATHSLDLTESLHLQTAMIREEATIKQNSLGIQNERSFDSWKPRVELRYDMDKQSQFRFLIDRTVSQLNLRNFIATRNTDDDTINFGNPDLQPEKTLRYKVAYEYRLLGDAGTVEVELFKDDISDFISSTRNADGSSGTGNVGTATQNGFNFKTSGKLDFIGLDSARMTFAYRRRDTEMIDPFLNVPKPINGTPEERFEMDFRHDLKDLGIVYGFDLNKRTQRIRQNRTLSEIRSNILDVDEAFVEYSVSPETKLRFEIWRPFKDRERYDRTFYDGDIADGVVDRIEYRQRELRPVYMLKIQSIF